MPILPGNLVCPGRVTVLLLVYGLRPTVSLIRLRKNIFYEKWPFFRLACALADVASSLQEESPFDVLELLILGTVWRVFRLDNYRFKRTRNKAMSEKKKIRIIKKGEKPRPIVKAKAASARETARDMVETVSNWVNEFQQKRRDETTHALRMLSKTPRGSEA
jgi:hypothetical protein